MASVNGGSLREEESSMAARAAWLHYAGGLTQAQVAKRLGLTSLKAHRLITKALRRLSPSLPGRRPVADTALLPLRAE